MWRNYALLLMTCFITNFKCSKACNGYQVLKQTFKNCLDDSVIQVANGDKSIQFNIDNNCNLIMSGCVEVTKPFQTAKVKKKLILEDEDGTYKIKKLPLPPVEGDMDFCEIASSLDDPKLQNVLQMFGIPTQCPFPAKKICGGPDKKISIGDFKNQLGLAAGNSQAKIEIEHDSGQSCIEFSVTIGKVKRG